MERGGSSSKRERKTVTPIDIVKHITSGIASREEYLSLGLDRGCGIGMKLEKWMLIEMLSKLLQLRKDGFVNVAEGEHNYPIKGSGWCDLWWCVRDEEHWLEAKTLVLCNDDRKADLAEVNKDLKKKGPYCARQIYFII